MDKIRDSESTMVVPQNMLSQDALDQLVEEFVLREGTDYGSKEYSLDEKKQHIYKQLEKKMIFIAFDFKEETTTLIKKEQLPKELINC